MEFLKEKSLRIVYVTIFILFIVSVNSNIINVMIFDNFFKNENTSVSKISITNKSEQKKLNNFNYNLFDKEIEKDVYRNVLVGLKKISVKNIIKKEIKNNKILQIKNKSFDKIIKMIIITNKGKKIYLSDNRYYEEKDIVDGFKIQEILKNGIYVKQIGKKDKIWISF